MIRTLRLLLPALAVAVLAAGCERQKTCPSDQRLCGGACTTLDTDPRNCGACGNVCAAGQTCGAGACVCAEGTTCGAACVDLGSNADHCGACGVACPQAQVCTTPAGGAATCADGCATGQTPCGRACVDLQSHRENCGACGRACGSRERCSAGRCVADLYVACYASDEVREATAALAPAGVPLAVAPGPNGLAWTGDLLAVASSRRGGAEVLSLLHRDPPGVRAEKVLELSAAQPDLEFLVEHEGVLYVSHNSLGTVLLVTPAGTVLDEVRLAPTGAKNPNPQGITFDDAGRAYVALAATGELVVLDVTAVTSCAAGTRAPPCTSEVARIDLSPLASPGAVPMPYRIAVTGGRAFVSLSNLTPTFEIPAGATGRIAVLRTDTLELDAAFAGSTNGLLDLGTSCLNTSYLAVRDGRLYVSCGAYGPAGQIVGSGITPVDLTGAQARVLPMVTATDQQAPGKLAFCGATGYVADRNSGTVWVFDPASGSTTLGPGTPLCPISQEGWAYVSDVACGR